MPSISELPDIPPRCLSCPPIVHENEEFIQAIRIRDAMIFNLRENELISIDDQPTLEEIDLQNLEVETRRKKLQEVGARAIGCAGLLILTTNTAEKKYMVGICDSPVFTEDEEHYESALVRRRDR